MLVNYVEWNCSECESKNRELCNIHMYGSPIRICKKCHAEHLDTRFREPALLGLTGTDDDKHWLEIFFSCLLLTAISFFVVYTPHSGRYSLIFGIMSGFLAIFIFAAFIKYKIGMLFKSNRKYMEESKTRLQDRLYVKKLRRYGYKISEALIPPHKNMRSPKNIKSGKKEKNTFIPHSKASPISLGKEMSFVP